MSAINLLSQDSGTPHKNEVGMVQVHGAEVAVVGKKDAGQVIRNCDGLITNDPGISLGISTADCIPLALFDPRSNSIGLIHAGWRGLAKDISANALKLLKKEFLVDPKNLIAEMGPHICQKHYEIGLDVFEEFSGYPKAIKKTNAGIFLDLGEVLKEQLLALGLTPANIKIDTRCTFEDLSLPSFRRGDLKKRIHYFLNIPDSP